MRACRRHSMCDRWDAVLACEFYKSYVCYVGRLPAAATERKTQNGKLSLCGVCVCVCVRVSVRVNLFLDIMLFWYKNITLFVDAHTKKYPNKHTHMRAIDATTTMENGHHANVCIPYHRM